MQRLRNLSEIYQKRLIRGEYAHHQATPYATPMDASLFNTDGSIRIPLSSDSTPLQRSVAPFTLNGSLPPGLCLTRTVGEAVAYSTGSTTVAERPFGLSANWVGGDFDEIGPQNVGSGVLGCWRGVQATFTLLAPAFNSTGLSAAFTASQTTGVPVYLYAGTDSRLVYIAPASVTATQVPVARLIDFPATSRITIELIDDPAGTGATGHL